MLNYRNINIVFAGFFFAGLIAWLAGVMPVYLFMILGLVYLLFIGYGCYNVGSNFFIPVICSLKTAKKVVAISFDDGPNAENTPQILQMLKDADVSAAFFFIGNHIPANEAVVKQAYEDGHLISNHTFSHHFWFDLFSAEKMLADMHKMDQEVYRIIGKMPKLFRPPYGVTNPNLSKAIVRGNYIPVGWNIRSLDTMIKNERKLFDKVVSKLRPGAVFLFHDTSAATVAILPVLMQHIKSHGYEILRLDKMLNLPAYA
jgi:peptidoglycan/xylan/chitin deacetylase (PgdA/CDA1 family)